MIFYLTIYTDKNIKYKLTKYRYKLLYFLLKKPIYTKEYYWYVY